MKRAILLLVLFIFFFVNQQAFTFTEIKDPKSFPKKIFLDPANVQRVVFQMERYRKSPGNTVYGYLIFYDAQNQAGIVESRNSIEIWTKVYSKPTGSSFDQKNNYYQKINLGGSGFRWIKLPTGEVVSAFIIKPFSAPDIKPDDIFRCVWVNDKTQKTFRLTSVPGF